MKRNLIVICIATLVMFTSSCSTKQSPKELKVMVWNIWHGVHSVKYPDKACEGVLGMLKKSEADVILMIETYGSSANVADKLGFYHRLISSNLSIYSRYPIIKTYTLPEDSLSTFSTFNLGGVEIDMDGTKVRLFDTWLCYKGDSTRVPQIKQILPALAPFIAEADEIPLIMGGDFNCRSHLDKTETTDMYRRGVLIDWTVTKDMEKVGFKDSYRELYPDPVANKGVTIGLRRESERNRGGRIDYIFYTGKTIQATESETHYGYRGEMYSFYGEDFFYGSDHGMVLTTFKIEN